jgi:Carboxypeptidase regulatory-like domain/TonB dependent receptor-like, beta-barrel
LTLSSHDYRLVVTWLILAASISSPMCRAQSTAGGTITGTVVDPDHRVVADATVTIRNNDFTSERTLTTDAGGNFVAISMPAGTYSVRAAAKGFKPKKANRVLLSVGSSVRLTFQLDLAGVAQSVTVTGRRGTVEGNTVAPAMNKDEPESENFFAGLTVTYLPNRDRDFSEFGQLSAGVDSGVGRGLVVAGQRPAALQTEIDGASFDDPLEGGMRGASDNAMFFPQTVVREFQVVHAGAEADVGGTNAGFVNIVTKQGSNKLHGEGFYIGRPNALSSRDAFNHSLDNEQNEFGGSLGGPIRKNHSFFYAGFEQDFLHVPYWTEFQQQGPGVVVPDSLASLQQQIVERNNPTALFGRMDFLLSAKNTLNVAFNFNRLNASDMGDGLTRIDASSSHVNALAGNSEWARGSLSTVLRTNLVNQFLLGWSRDRRDYAPNSTAPEMFINGFGELGGDGLTPHTFTSSRLQATDDVAFSRGSAIVHFGAGFAYDPATEAQEPNLNGRFDFDSLNDFLALNPRRYQQTFVSGDARYDAAVRELGLYATGKFSIAKHLALTAGLRWDGEWNPQPNSPNAAIAQTTRIPNDLKQWQPRLGLAWNPRPNTVVRISSGLYDAPTPATIFHRVFSDNGANIIYADSYFDPEILPLVTSGGLHSLTAPPALLVPAAAIVGIDPDFRNPRSFQLAGSVEQQISARVNVSAGYVHNSTFDLQRRVDRNLFPPVSDVDGLPIFGPTRPNPAIGRLLINESSAHSSYNGFLLTSNFQVSRRTQVMANYTLARARDDDSNLGPFSIDSAVDPFDLAAERAYSSFDIRHTFNLSAIVNLPLGFKVNPALIARSGLPYTPIVGFDLQNDANDFNDRAILNGAMVTRNSARQPSFANLDIRFVKDITLRGEGHHLDLFLDIFNLTGAQNMNFGPEAVSFYGTAAAPVFTAGQPLFAPDTNHFGGARQVQFTARIVAF